MKANYNVPEFFLFLLKKKEKNLSVLFDMIKCSLNVCTRLYKGTFSFVVWFLMFLFNSWSFGKILAKI